MSDIILKIICWYNTIRLKYNLGHLNRKINPKIEKVNVLKIQPDQILAFFVKGVRTASQMNYVHSSIKCFLDVLKIPFIMLPSETFERIEVIDKTDVKPDGTIIQHHSIIL